MFCTNCQTPILETTESQRYRHRKTGRIFCTGACGYAHREAGRVRLPPPRPSTTCSMCPRPADLSGFRLAQWNATGRAYCSRTCSTAYRAAISSQTMSQTNKRHAAGRMRANNPMRSEATRLKVSATLQRIGHRPAVQGGNGRQIPVAEATLILLFQALGFVPQLVVRTGAPQGSGLPRSYKLDMGHPTLKIALEADGPSHNGKRRALDAKRDQCLGDTLQSPNDIKKVFRNQLAKC